MKNPCLSWALASVALAARLDQAPLPKGINDATVGKWRLVLNNSRLEVPFPDGPQFPELKPFELYVSNVDFVAIGLLAPDGGLIGGYTEDRFIAEIIPHLPQSALNDFAEELDAFEEYHAKLKEMQQ